MKEFFKQFASQIDSKRIMRRIEKLTALEFGQTFDDYHRAAEYAKEMLLEDGFDNVHYLEFPADGKSVYLDRIMPMAWRATKGRLTVLNPPRNLKEPVIADYQRHPFHLVKGSVSTPPEGLISRIITEQQMISGEDAQGALIITEPLSPLKQTLKTALDLGAIGIVTDTMNGRYDLPDGLPWVNGLSETKCWHVVSDDRDFIAFAVSPRIGDQLRNMASQENIKVKIESDGERFEGTFPTVTAVLPGKRKEEIWLLAHMFEPLASDNCVGVVASIEILRLIRELTAKGVLPELEFSIRVAFSMEAYGFSAFAEHQGAYLADKVIGAINLDTIPDHGEESFYIRHAAQDFFGNYLQEILMYECSGAENLVKLHGFEAGTYSDDTFMSDPSIGIPTVWPRGGKEGKLHHNSGLTTAIIEPETLSASIAFIGLYTASLSSLCHQDIDLFIKKSYPYALNNIKKAKNKAQLKHFLNIEKNWLRNFKRVKSNSILEKIIDNLQIEAYRLLQTLEDYKIPQNKYLSYAENFVFKRSQRGLLRDLSKLDKDSRLSVSGINDHIVVDMDGKKNLRELIELTQLEQNIIYNDKQVKKIINSMCLMAQHGYFTMECSCAIDKKQIIIALRELGAELGDLLLVHSSTAGCGYIEDGSDTIISAISDTVGNAGTALFPSFTNKGFIYFDGNINKSKKYRPHDFTDLSQISTGNIPRRFLELSPDSPRSKHLTHSWTGKGKLAATCLKVHEANDSPCSKMSPMAFATKNKGKILYFGCGLGPSTFLHHLEDVMDLKYLQNALVNVKTPDGGIKSILIPKEPPGHRDFYSSDAENCKFFTEAKKRGLQIKKQRLGLGYLHLIDCQQLFEIGSAIIKDDPNILLCDNIECAFCSSKKVTNI